MQFNSYVFILLFMPFMLIAYFVGNRINLMIGKAFLIAGSVVFIVYSDWTTAIVMGMSLLVNFSFAKLIERTKKWDKLFMLIPVIVNVSLLLYFKYTNFIIGNINIWFGREIALKELILPLGISFFTFQQIAYIVAIYKKEIEKTNLFDYLVYILYFPKLFMGPLMDPVEFIIQINDRTLKKFNWDNIAYGVKIFSFGLFKKMLLADTFAKAVSWGYANLETASSVDWILVMLFYTFEIYFDFSGYSDMAVGSSLMLNITLPINFNSPYKAISIRDFWKRWHISLTKFFTKYIYIPLGGSKKGNIFTCANILIVFLISGIWHGANWTFIIWGILYGIINVLDRIIEKKAKMVFEFLRWSATFTVVNIMWLLFRSDSVVQWWSILRTIGCLDNKIIHEELIKVFTLPEETFICGTMPIIDRLCEEIRGFWMYLFIALSSFICFVPENNYQRLQNLSVATAVLAAFAFLWSFICLGSESVFVYFNF